MSDEKTFMAEHWPLVATGTTTLTLTVLGLWRLFWGTNQKQIIRDKDQDLAIANARTEVAKALSSCETDKQYHADICARHEKTFEEIKDNFKGVDAKLDSTTKLLFNKINETAETVAFIAGKLEAKDGQ